MGTKAQKKRVGVQKFHTRPYKCTGYILKSYIDAVLSRIESSRMRREGIREFFEAFIVKGPRAEIGIQEIISLVGFQKLLNQEARLRDLITAARNLSWNLTIDTPIGSNVPPNVHFLMPTLDRSRQQVVIEQVFAVSGERAKDIFTKKYRPAFLELHNKLINGEELSKSESFRISTLSIALGLHDRLGPDDISDFFGFEILENLRRTDFRIVDIAFDHSTNEKVVLKRLTSEGMRIERERLAFIRGFEAIQSLRDPDVPRVVHPLSEHNSAIFYTMEYRNGIPISELKLESEKETLHLLLQISAALQRLHSNGILHGDLSPDNIMFNDTNEVNFVDFECAAPVETSMLSRSIARMTNRYASPEKKADVFRLKPSDDVFSFGIVAAELLLKAQELPHDVVGAIDSKYPNFSEFIAICLSDEKGGRFKTAIQMGVALRNAVSGSKIGNVRPIIRSTGQYVSYVGETLDGQSFSNMDLRGIDFSNSIIKNCDFQNALLSNATFQNAEITNSYFNGAFLLSCRFHNAYFHGNVNFSKANLERTVWDQASVENCDFSWANFWGAFLAQCQGLEESNTIFANLYRNELSHLQSEYIKKNKAYFLFEGSYLELGNQWNSKNENLVWWLEEIQKPNGLVGLY